MVASGTRYLWSDLGPMPALPLPRLPRRRQYPWEWSPGLEAVQSIACDVTAGSALDAAASPWEPRASLCSQMIVGTLALSYRLQPYDRRL